MPKDKIKFVLALSLMVVVIVLIQPKRHVKEIISADNNQIYIYNFEKAYQPI